MTLAELIVGIRLRNTRFCVTLKNLRMMPNEAQRRLQVINWAFSLSSHKVALISPKIGRWFWSILSRF